MLVRDLDDHNLDNELSPEQDQEQVSEALNLLFQNYPEFLNAEDLSISNCRSTTGSDVGRLLANKSHEDA